MGWRRPSTKAPQASSRPSTSPALWAASASSAIELAAMPNTTCAATRPMFSVAPTAKAVPKRAGACAWSWRGRASWWSWSCGHAPSLARPRPRRPAPPPARAARFQNTSARNATSPRAKSARPGDRRGPDRRVQRRQQQPHHGGVHPAQRRLHRGPPPQPVPERQHAHQQQERRQVDRQPGTARPPATPDGAGAIAAPR